MDGFRTFSWTPTAGQAGSYDVTFTVSDGQLSDSETMTITVTVSDIEDRIVHLGQQDDLPVVGDWTTRSRTGSATSKRSWSSRSTSGMRISWLRWAS